MVVGDISWCLRASTSFQLKCWDNECVLYDAVTGDTHLIARYAASVLERLAAAPNDRHSFQALCVELTEDELEGVLLDFENRELVCRV